MTSRFEQARERIRAQGYRPGIEAMRLRFVDLEEQKFWRQRKREAEKRERAISERIQKQKDDREQRRLTSKVERQLHRSLSRYEDLPEGA